MHGAHHRKIWTSYQNGSSSFGKMSANASGSKNDACTLSQPDVFGISHTSSSSTITVE